MAEHEKLNYVEFSTTDMQASKAFFSDVFGWEFVDYGQEYTAFTNQGLDGGLYPAQQASTVETGGALLVFYSNDLNASLQKVQDAGARIIKPIFSFPGGCRFEFIEPGGNHLAIWSDKE